ncbi:hypothetical protein KGS77_01360 [Streptomyces sp. MST-110588]|nr:hypothetical protein KGS77_01360 [Streptomyces sp. MST-110588]
MVVHAALAAALGDAGAGRDLPIGLPLSGRDEAALDGLIGCVVNMVVLRTDTSGEPTYRELIGRVRDRLLAAHDHQDFPFDRVVELLNPPRSSRRHPVFQTAVTYLHLDPAAGEETWPDGPSVRIRPMPLAHTELDLLFQFRELRDPGNGPGGIEGELLYSSSLVTKETATHIVDSFKARLSALCTDLDARVDVRR